MKNGCGTPGRARLVSAGILHNDKKDGTYIVYDASTINSHSLIATYATEPRKCCCVHGEGNTGVLNCLLNQRNAIKILSRVHTMSLL